MVAASVAIVKSVRVRLRDVARAAHVSPSTASAALAGKSGVSAETRAVVVAAAQRLGYRPDSSARRLRAAKTPVIAVLVDPLLREGSQVASMSFAGRLLTRLSEAAVDRHATAVILPSDRPAPPADAVVLIETGTHVTAPADLGFGVPIIYTGVRWEGWGEPRVSLTFNFDEVAATVLSALQDRGCTAIQVCRPVARATWLHKLADGCGRVLEPSAFHDYSAQSAGDSQRCGFDAAMAGDAVFLISNRRQGEIVAGVRRADRQTGRSTPLVVLGEGVIEAAYDPPVGVLSLAPAACADALIDAALWALEHPDEDRHVTLPFIFTDIPS